MFQEGASFWNVKITWQNFFCAMIAATILNLLNGVANPDVRDGFLGAPGMLTFGRFSQETTAVYNVYEVFFFICIGCLGGLMGAFFNFLNEHITIFRLKYVNRYPVRRFGEVLAVTFLVSLCTIMVPFITNDCTSIASVNGSAGSVYVNGKPLAYSDYHACAVSTCKCGYELRSHLIDIQGDIYEESYDGPYHTAIDCQLQPDLEEALISFTCNDDEYSAAASILWTTGDRGIKFLLHNKDQLDGWTLFIVFIIYFFLACVTYGIGVPSGLFVPSLLTGAIYGRLCGELFAMAGMLGENPDRSRVGVYALIGASAMLTGMARITISLTVILLECTNDVQYLLPIMLAVMFAKWIGDLFNEGLYDIHIHLKHVPFLEPFAEGEFDAIRVEDIMSRRVEALPQIARLSKILDTLRETDHSTFPVTTMEGASTPRPPYRGMMRRDYLLLLLSWRDSNGRPLLLQDRPSDEAQEHSGVPPVEHWARIMNDFGASAISLDDAVHDYTGDDMDCYIDLRPYMNKSAFTIRKTALVTRAYTIFRGMGLRSLPVLDDDNFCLGLITREDLLHDSIVEGRAIAEERRPHEFEGSVMSTEVKGGAFSMIKVAVEERVARSSSGSMRSNSPRGRQRPSGPYAGSGYVAMHD